jgi:hypothetical protein
MTPKITWFNPIITAPRFMRRYSWTDNRIIEVIGGPQNLPRPPAIDSVTVCMLIQLSNNMG